MLELAPGMSRLGTETAFEVLARAETLRHAGRDIINLGIGQPDFKTPPHVVEAAVQALHDGHHGYTPAPGILALREAVAADIAHTRAITVDPEHIVCVPGGKVTMFFAILMFGQPGAEILYPNPGFPIYESVISYTGATAVPIPLLEERDFSFDAAHVLSLITPQTRLIIINSPANPTGGAVPREEIETLVAGLERHPHVAILSDEIYSQMTYDGRAHTSLLTYEHLREPADHARWLVKDLRNDRLAARLCTVAGGARRAGNAAGDQLPFVRQRADPVRRHRRARRPAGFGARDGRGVRRAPPHHRRRTERRARLVMPHTRRRVSTPSPNITATGLDARTLQDRLLEEAGVATVAGTSFGHLGEGYVRFSYANSVGNIRAALSRVRDLLDA